jgi:hypothetical protein
MNFRRRQWGIWIGLKIKLNLKRIREAQVEEASKRAQIALTATNDSDSENDVLRTLGKPFVERSWISEMVEIL